MEEDNETKFFIFQLIWDFLDVDQTAQRKEYSEQEQKEMFKSFMLHSLATEVKDL